MSEQNTNIDAQREKQLSVIERVIQSNADALDADLREIANTLSATERPQIPEVVFVNMFLPYFANDPNPEHVVELGHWLNVSKNIFQSVDVVNDIGEVLFTVPPIARRDALHPLENRSINIFNVVWKAQQLALVSQGQADHYVAGTMIPQSEVMLSDQLTAITEDVKSWNEILKRYGRPPIAITAEEKVAETKEREEINYDDWAPL